MKRKISDGFRLSQTDIRRSFRKRLKELREQASDIAEEDRKEALLDMIDTAILCFAETRFKSAGDMIDYVISETDQIRIAISTSLYGMLDPQTQKLFDDAEDRAMEYAYKG
ncbi:hypothetical protein [Bradyrhizobium iriomotense]|uniref:hypothetical protein n=1 Tax=Bradyrhizobium iriomotense TaxID=441950 RepID=UPI001B8A8986|nr:hypothetical protein [Bradyrhizobium iriomotense]MBR0783935.1 hypothetical protein [Bradyrhizobium iriomotense]